MAEIFSLSPGVAISLQGGISSSKNLASTVNTNTVISAGPAVIFNIFVYNPDSEASATLFLYDNATTNSGTYICRIDVGVTATFVAQPKVPIPCVNGIVARITGTSAVLQVFVQYQSA